MTQTTEPTAPIFVSDAMAAGDMRAFPRYPAYRESGVPWLGAIPIHWEVKRLKFVAGYVTSGSRGWAEYYSDDGPIFVRIGNLSQESVDLKLDDVQHVMPPSGAEGERTRTQSGDVLISITANIGSVGVVPDALGEAYVNQHVALARPQQHLVSPRWLSYCLSSVVGQSQFKSLLYGGTKDGLSLEDVKNVQFFAPPQSEQRAIAAFLDRETARIDALVAAKRRLIELLREKRAALISRAVTRGLDASAPLRESGVPSVGKVPAHWRVERNKVIFREAGERSVDGQEELLTVSHITGVTRRSEKDVTMFMAESFEGYKLCRPGDLAVNTMWAWMGAVGIARELGIVSPSYNVYRLRAEVAAEYDPEYLDLLYRTPAYVCEINRYSQGIWDSRLRLYPEAFFSMQTLTPPVHEQHQIVEHCRSEMARLDAFSQKLSESIERLREYRTALIAAAVTGAIDVRESARADTSSDPVQEARHG